MKRCIICGKPADVCFSLELIRYHYYADEDDYGGGDSLWTYNEIFVCDEHEDWKRLKIVPILRMEVKYDSKTTN